MNPCIFTGAQVKLLEYGGFVSCDIFIYNNVYIITGFGEMVFPEEEQKEKAEQYLDASLYVEQGFFKRPQNFIVIDRDRLRWTAKGWERARTNMEYDGITEP